MDLGWVSWGDAPAWAALVIASGAGVYAHLAWRANKRMADAADEALKLQKEAAEKYVPNWTLRRESRYYLVLKNASDEVAMEVRVEPAIPGDISALELTGDAGIIEAGSERPLRCVQVPGDTDLLNVMWKRLSGGQWQHMQLVIPFQENRSV